jgi:putative addiction module killer protein
MAEIVEYIALNGQRPFAKWFDGLDAHAAAKVTVYISRAGKGNFSRVEGIGGGIFECRIDFGPGYRVYFGKDGERFIILLGGGIKKTQPGDIKEAKRLWHDYKARKGRS